MSSRHRPKRNRIVFITYLDCTFVMPLANISTVRERGKKRDNNEINSLSHSISIVLTAQAQGEHYSSPLHSLNNIFFFFFNWLTSIEPAGDYDIRQKIELHSACVSDPICGSKERKNSLAECDCIRQSSSSHTFWNIAFNLGANKFKSISILINPYEIPCELNQ